MKKKIISIIMLAIMIASPTVKAMSLDSIKNSCSTKTIIVDDLYEDEEFVKDVQKYLMEVYGEEWNSILKMNAESVNIAKKIEQKIAKKSTDKITYPNYYGGMYIDEKDNLVVQVTKKNIPSTKSKNYKTYEEILNMDENIKIEEVKYSYEELENVHKIILDYFMESDNNIVTGLYIDILSNSVVVELKNNNDITIYNFKKDVIDSPIVRYENEREFQDMVNPGGSMYLGIYNDKPQYCSWGYRAKNGSGQTGMVTAAHCIDGRTVFSYVEPYTVRKKQNSGTIDAAWIVVSSPTNTLDQQPSFSNVTTLSTTVISSFYSGQKIAKLGRTTGYTIGTITNPSYSGTFGTKFTDLVLSSLPVNGGDSGGIVMEQTATFGNDFGTMGIVKAAEIGTTNMVFCKASNINSIFGISRY